MTPNPPSKGTVERGAVVPAWHTLVLLAVIFGLSLASDRAGSLTPFGPKTGRALGYLLVIIFEWAKRNSVVAGVSPANFSPVTRPAYRGGFTRYIMKVAALAPRLLWSSYGRRHSGRR